MTMGKEQEIEARRVYDLYWKGYLTGDEAAFASTLDDEMSGIWTAENEVFDNRADIIKCVQDTADQVVGKADFRNRNIIWSEVNGYFLIRETSDLYILIDGTWTFYSKIRVSTLMRKVEGEWKIRHQHGSLPDPRVAEGETFAPEQIKQENYQLREAIKRRTIELEAKNRELEIEASLERVRMQAIAMRKPDDLLAVSGVLFRELSNLNFQNLRNAMIDIYHEDQKYFLNYDFSDALGESITRVAYDIHPVVERHLKLIRGTHDAFEQLEFAGKELEDWKEFRRRNGEMDDPRLDVHQALYYYFYSIGVGDIGISTFEPIGAEKQEILKRFRNVFDFAYRRYVDVEQAEAHARETQIELSLERVRTKSMAMHRSEELVEASDVFFEQLASLGIESIRTGVATFDEQGEAVEVWSRSHIDGKSAQKILGVVPKNSHPFFEKCFEAWKQKQPYFAQEFTGNEVAEYYGALGKILSYPVATSFNPTEWFYTFFFVEGSINVVRQSKLTDDEAGILQRFAGVFGQMYRRFLDLQTAEAQAREAKIEAALERVRSRTMAMQKSDELTATSFVLFEQLKQLGEVGNQVSIGIFDEHEEFMWMYATSYGTQWERISRVALDGHEVMKRFHDAWKGHKKSLVVDLMGEELASYNDWRSNLSDAQYTTGTTLAESRWIIHCAFFTRGQLSFSTTEPRPKEIVQLLERFAAVFDLTYTRFLDLKQAEAQAREATIEAALERVRAKAMAMRDSGDLSATTSLVFAEMRKLGINSERSGVVLLSEGTPLRGTVYATATAVEGEAPSLVGTWLASSHPVFQQQYDYWLRRESFVTTLKNEELRSYYDAIYSQLHVPQPRPEVGDREEYGYFFPFSEGWFYAWTKERYTEDQQAVLGRFKSIVELTFRRYQDIQRAEAQARESQIEASLERVRSRTLAMQKSDELAETAAVLFRQLIGLGIAPNRLYITIIKDDSGNAEFWITDEDGSKVNSAFATNLESNSTFQKMFAGWKEGRTSITIDMNGEELQQYFQQLAKLNVPFKGGLSQTRRVQTIAYFSRGYLGIASPDEQPEETIFLLERFAAVFNLTFTRFNDLKLAEAQAEQAHRDLIQLQAEKKRAEDALTELRAMQAQLLQQEKLASLGQLTAGIAHEIKNPLNFVNNFSSVSVELLDELAQEIKNAAPDSTNPEIPLLLADIRTNLNKIIQHGTRADGIVKSMLQHSRGGSGKKEPVDLNGLVKEYANLAFHGMRAGKNPINVDIVLDLDDATGKVPVIAEDFSRVLI
ncbi:MAG: nuclear transport factor 2 family protein, partial [Candidatus Zixiibacteriota bacterium]